MTDVDETGDQIFTLAKLLARLLLTWGSGYVSKLMSNMSSAYDKPNAKNIFSSACVFETILTMMKRKFNFFKNLEGRHDKPQGSHQFDGVDDANDEQDKE